MKSVINIRISKAEKVASFIFIFMSIVTKVIINNEGWYNRGRSTINNPAFFPDMAGYALIISSIIIFINSFGKDKDETVEVNLLGIAIVSIWMIYAFLMETIGFIIGGIFVIMISMVIWGEKKKLTIILVSLIAPVLVYIFLGTLMGVSFPKGLLRF